MKLSERKLQVYLPASQYRSLQRESERRGASLASIVRDALDLYFTRRLGGASMTADRLDSLVGYLPADGTTDLAARHDEHLYGP